MMKKWIIITLVSFLVISIGISSYYFVTNYKMMSNGKWESVQTQLGESEQLKEKYKKKEIELKENQEKLEKVKEVVQDNIGIINKQKEQISELEIELEIMQNKAPVQYESSNIENQTGSESTEAVTIPVVQAENVNMSVTQVEAPFDANYKASDKKLLFVNVFIENNSSQILEVRPYNLKLVLEPDGYPMIQEDLMIDYMKRMEMMPIYGMLVMPYTSNQGAVIYEIPKDSTPVSISWDGPFGEVIQYLN